MQEFILSLRVQERVKYKLMLKEKGLDFKTFMTD